MARFNIETSIFKDQGFQDLMIAVGDRQKAKGIVWELFELAQEYWFPRLECIPLDVFERRGLPACLYAPGGLAELRNGGVYVRGSKDAFAWLFEASEKGKKGGRASALARAKTTKPKKPTKRRQNDEPENSTGQPQVEHRSTSVNLSEASLLSSLSSSLSSLNSNSNLSSQELLRKGEERENAPSPQPGNPAVAEFYSAWRERYEGRAPLMPPDHAKLKQLTEAHGPELARNLVRAYLRMSNSWFVTKRHDVQTLMSNLTAVQHFIDTGQVVTSDDARNAEAGDSLRNQMQRMARGR